MINNDLLVCNVIAPLVRDSDRKKHQPFVLDYLRAAFWQYGGEHSLQIMLIRGSWKPSEEDPPVEDESLKYTIYVPRDRVSELRELMHKIGNTLDQRTMALEIEGKAELIDVQRSRGFLWDD